MNATPAIRQEPRFATREAMPVCAKVTSGDRTLEGRLADLSYSGARVDVDEPLPFEAPVTLSLSCPAAGFELSLEGVIRWTRPLAEGDRWSLGIHVTQVASEGRVAEFFTRGIVDRRGKPRVAVQAAAPARFELNCDEAQVELLNAAAGGCCLTTSAACREGQKVRFTPPEAGGQTLLAEVCWARRIDDRWLAGCRFLPECSGAAIELLCRRMNVLKPPRRARGEFLTAAAILLALTAGAVAWTWKLLT